MWEVNKKPPKPTVVNPVTDRNTGSNQHSFDHDQFSTLVGLRGLGLPGWHSTSVHAISPTSDNTANNPLLKVV